MASLKDIVAKRLDQLQVGPVEAAVAAGLERTFIRDIIEGRKKSVRADKLGPLADALGVDMVALSEGKLLLIEAKLSPKPVKSEQQSIERLWELFDRVRKSNPDIQLQVIRLIEGTLGPDQAKPRDAKSRATKTKPAS